MRIRPGRFVTATVAMSAVLTLSACVLPDLLGGANSALASTARSTHTINVTNADNGRSFRLHLNDRLVLTLAGPARYVWTMPFASNTAVLKRTSGNSGSTATATFLAVKKGVSTVSAAGNPSCRPACMAPSRLFRIAVTVVH